MNQTKHIVFLRAASLFVRLVRIRDKVTQPFLGASVYKDGKYEDREVCQVTSLITIQVWSNMTSFTHIEVCVSETVVGLTIGSPTVVVPGSRQGKPIEAHEVYRVAQVAG